MRKLLVPLAVVAFASCTKTAVNTAPGEGDAAVSEVEKTISAASRSNLTAFSSEEDSTKFFDDVVAAQKRDTAHRASASTNGAVTDMTTAPAASASAADNAKDEGITNNQVAGVDEGGIVKAHGDFSIVLRRGRLFTVRVGDDSLTPVSHVDAFGPDIDPRGGWYDEMLVSGNTIAVVGYSVFALMGYEIVEGKLDGAKMLERRRTSFTPTR